MAVQRPAAGTATRRVWDIADEMTARGHGLARRAEVIRRYVEEGGNANTASTQYHNWKVERLAAQPEQALVVSLKVSDGGRIVLPAEIRAALGIGEGDFLRAEVADGEVRLTSRERAIRRAQARVRRYVPEGAALVDRLLEERRKEEGKPSR